MITDLNVQHELLKTALHATDTYLSIESAAKQAGKATPVMLNQFTAAYNQAWQALDSLGVLNQHEEYMRAHLKAITDMSAEEDVTLADDPYAAAPGSKGEVDEAVKPLKIKIKSPPPSAHDRFKQSLKKAGYDPDAGAKRLEDLLAKQKKERESSIQKEEVDEDLDGNKLTEADIEEMVNSLSWEDIVDYYDDDELVEDDKDEKIDEALSAQARLKKRQAFSRSKGKRGVALRMKLRRASTTETLKKRAVLAARRSLYKRLLKGRDKSQLSASEKNRVEQSHNFFCTTRENKNQPSPWFKIGRAHV